MLAIQGEPRRVCNGLTRRNVLQVAGAGLFGTSLTSLLAAEEAGLVTRPRAKSVLFLFLFGGPSQLETFDMKPDAPSTIRGPYQPITSRTPGLMICEKLPKLAALSDKYAVIRTVTHSHNDHNACHYIQTGHPLPPAQRGAAMVDATEKDWPAQKTTQKTRHSTNQSAQVQLIGCSCDLSSCSESEMLSVWFRLVSFLPYLRRRRQVSSAGVGPDAVRTVGRYE